MESLEKSGWPAFFRAELKGMLKVFFPPVFVAFVTMLLLYETDNTLDSWLNARKWPPLQADNYTGRYVHHILLLSVVALVMINTLVYAYDNLGLAHAGKRRLAYLVLTLVLACIFLNFFWGLDLVFGWIGFSESAHEVIAMLIFALFGVIDYSFYKETMNALAPEQVKEGQDLEFLKAQSFLFQLIFVDLPVVFGILAVAILIKVIEGAPALGSDSGASAYLRGFATGAIVMHMAASQAIFLLIYFYYYHKRFKSTAQGERAQSK